MSKRTVSSVLAGMERKGWLRREHHFANGGRKAANRYSLTIWDVSWAIADRAGGAIGQEMPHGYGAGGAHSIGQEVHGDRAGGAHKEEQDKKNKKKKPKNPPNPPTGERRPMAVDRDRGEQTTDRGEQTEQPGVLLATQPQPQQPAERRELPEQAPGTEPSAPVKPKARKASAVFRPANEDVPAALLPVWRELLAFWPTRRGAKTLAAWELLCRELQRIQDHPQGGTEIVRSQLEQGAMAGIDGRPWQSIRFSNWERYGTKAGHGRVAQMGKRSTMDRVMGAIALVEEREQRAAAAAAAAEHADRSGLMLAEVA